MFLILISSQKVIRVLEVEVYLYGIIPSIGQYLQLIKIAMQRKRFHRLDYNYYTSGGTDLTENPAPRFPTAQTHPNNVSGTIETYETEGDSPPAYTGSETIAEAIKVFAIIA